MQVGYLAPEDDPNNTILFEVFDLMAGTIYFSQDLPLICTGSNSIILNSVPSNTVVGTRLSLLDQNSNVVDSQMKNIIVVN